MEHAGGHGLNLIANEDEPVDRDIGEVEADLGEVARYVFADDPQHRGALGMRTLDSLAGAVRAHPIARVAGDEPVLKQQGAGVAGAHMHHQRGVLAQFRQILEAAPRLQIDQARHFAIVDNGHPQAAGDADTVHHGFVVARLTEDVSRRCPGHVVRIETKLRQ